jgi:hypothetical protein
MAEQLRLIPRGHAVSTAHEDERAVAARLLGHRHHAVHDVLARPGLVAVEGLGQDHGHGRVAVADGAEEPEHGRAPRPGGLHHGTSQGVGVLRHQLAADQRHLHVVAVPLAHGRGREDVEELHTEAARVLCLPRAVGVG